MQSPMKNQQILELAVMWLLIPAYVLFWLDLSPKSAFVVSFFSDCQTLRFILALPSLIILAYWFVVFVKGDIDSHWKAEESPTTLIILLLLYVLYITMFTGGLASSPFVALATFVPLAGSDLLQQDKRLRILFIYALGVVILALISYFFVAIKPPQVYQTVWLKSGTNYSDIIQGVAIGICVFAEIGILRSRKVGVQVPTQV